MGSRVRSLPPTRVQPEMEKSGSYKSPVGSKLSRLVNKMILNDAGVCEACCNISGRFD